MKRLLEKLNRIASLKREIARLKKTIEKQNVEINNLEDEANFLLSEKNKYKEKNLELRRELDYLKAIARKDTNNEKHNN